MTADHSTMVDDCERRDHLLSDWEKQFIDSVRRRLDSGGTLTPKQAQTLNDCWDRVTDTKRGVTY